MGHWSHTTPHFEWRASQRHLLDIAGRVTDQRWHLCAPPGAGKTLIGLEVARQVDRPTLVLAPTTAIRDQWLRATAMFGAGEGFATRDPEVDAPLLAVTYQLLGNPGSATEELAIAARRAWRAEVALTFGDDQADARIAATAADDPPRARREIRRHLRDIRRSLGGDRRALESLGVTTADLLGARTVALIDQLVERDIGCVVLDECHHLLDWWALVVDALVGRLDPAVIGLTATLPDPESSREADNYAGLLGEVDAELHLSAMVAEGALAPWRDGVRLATVTDDEEHFLDEWLHRFGDELAMVLSRPACIEWAVAQIVDAQAAAPPIIAAQGDRDSWDRFWDRDPLAAMATARWWHHRGLTLPTGFDPPTPITHGPMTVDEQLVLIDAWLHHPASTATREDRDLVREITARYGVALTTNGVRWGRSVADTVCARSEAKAIAAADVAALELDRRGTTATILVVAERDQAGTAPAEARRVSGDDAGTMAVLVATLAAHPTTVTAGIVAVTGRGAWCDAANADRITTAIDLTLARRGPTGPSPTVRSVGCDIPGAVALTVDGATWSAADWLDAAEIALDARAVQVLVATRGLVGEGWDHPPLDVLIDCSEVASRAATTQLRGRALRLDPDRPDKVVSFWDVTVVHPGAPGDWHRLHRRHEHWWGLDPDGVLRTGIAKLGPGVDVDDPPHGAAMAAINRHSIDTVADVAATLRHWQSVDPAGVATAAIVVRSRRAPRRIATRVPTWRRLRIGAVGASALSVTAVAATAATGLVALAPLAVIGTAVAVHLGTATIARVRDQHEMLEALGESVVAGLAATGMPGLGTARVTTTPVATTVDGERTITLVIDGVDDDVAAAWSAAMAETLGPLDTPRWLLAADGEAWRVPASVGATRAAAEAFATAFRARVPHATLHRAGDPEATALVLAASGRRADRIESSRRWR